MDTTVAPNRSPRGIRNNNPGNVRASHAYTWLGQTGADLDGFVINSEPVFGLRQIMVIFHNYQLFYALRSTHQLIQRWAPGKDNNDVADYTRYMAGRIMVGINDPIDIRDCWCRWTHAIVLYENGQDPYDISLYILAHKLAFQSR